MWMPEKRTALHPPKSGIEAQVHPGIFLSVAFRQDRNRKKSMHFNMLNRIWSGWQTAADKKNRRAFAGWKIFFFFCGQMQVDYYISAY
jgi:hypothetical protein